MAIIESDTLHTPVIDDDAGFRRCQYIKSDGGGHCGLLDYEHAVTPETLEVVLTALSKYPAEGVWRPAQDIANEFGLHDNKDWLVRANAVITLRVENLPEEDTKVYFDDVARTQGLVKRLRDAVEDTDFYIEFDVTDLEVEEA